MALKKFQGKVSYADPVNGYGYVLPDSATDPAEAFMFTAEDVDADVFEFMVPGVDVKFSADPSVPDGRAQDVNPV